MDLQKTVSTIVEKDVTLEFSKDFADSQFGLLCAFIRSNASLDYRIFNIKIWNWQAVVLDTDVQFKTSSEAENYLLGFYNGLKFAKVEVTGYKVTLKK